MARRQHDEQKSANPDEKPRSQPGRIDFFLIHCARTAGLDRVSDLPQSAQGLGGLFNRLLLGHLRIPLIYGFVPVGDILAANGF